MHYKDTDIFSEIGKFFKEKDIATAMNIVYKNKTTRRFKHC